MNNYDDIINLPHHISTKRPHMSLHDRASQFAPFAALTGYEEEIAETARLTEKKIELDDNEIYFLNEKMQYIANNIDKKLDVTITYFVPDEFKEGGAYVDIDCVVKKFDEINHSVILMNDEKIPISSIISIEIK